MAGSFSDYLEDALLDHVFKAGTYSVPSNIFIALSTTALTDDDGADTTGDLPGEITADSYARITCDSWDASSGGVTANTSPVTFAQATGDWGVIVSFAICDAITGDNMLAHGSVAVTKNIESGDTARFATGDIDITLT